VTISLTHKFVSIVPDGTDTSVVRPSNWNDEHDITGTLPIANGGTNTTDMPTAGGVVYGTGTAQAYSAAGTAGYFLQSTGSGTPTWSSVTTPVGSPGYWGSFYDTTATQTGSTTVGTAVLLGQTDPNSNGVSIASGSRITFANTGVYNIQYSLQFINTNSTIYDVQVWLRKNGTDVADTNTVYAITGSHGGIDGATVAAINYVLNVTAGDYFQLMWLPANTSVNLKTIAASTTPAYPETPCAIVTAVQLTQIGLGYYGLTSTTSVALTTGSKTFTTNYTYTQVAFTVGTRVRAAYTTNPANYVEGVITSFDGVGNNQLVLNVDTVGGTGGPYASWAFSVAGSAGTVGGSTTQIQYNNAGALGGISGATTDGTSLTVSSGNLKLSGATSGTAILNAPATSGGTLTLPSGTTTLAGLGTAQTFTAAQVISSTSANAFVVGPNGTTNPSLIIDASAASAATGVKIAAAAAGSGVTVSAISSATDENLILAGKGAGVISHSTTSVYKTSATVTAGTNAQGQGALTSDLNVVTTAASSPSGVTLPAGVLGQRLVIINRGANTINAYPASGGKIDALATNASIAIPTSGWMEFIAVSSTQWYSTANMATTALWS